MSGIFHDGNWYESTDLKCRRCGQPVYESANPKYVYQCFNCDEDLYSFEAEEQDALYLPRVRVARHAEGITLNAEIEYLLDDNGEPLIFESQPAAEAHLMAHGVSAYSLEFLYFVEAEDGEK